MQNVNNPVGDQDIFKEDSFDATCKRCRKPFMARRFNLLGCTLTVSICGECGARAEQEEKEREVIRYQQAIQRDQKAREEAWTRFCPEEFRTESEGGSTKIARLELEQPKLKELLAWELGSRGLIIRGPSGKCKTRSVWRLVRKLWNDRKRVWFLTAGQFERQCRDAAGTFTLSQWFDRLATCDVFVLDDLGKTPWSPATEATFFDLVDDRTRNHRPIITTTNDDGESLASRMAPERADALIRRLRDYCDSITFT